LAARCGALVATSAVAKGLFRDDPYDLDISGGFSSPLAAELISQADLIIGWGCALNMWTMRHGALIAPDATVIQVDDTADATGRYRSLTFGVVADVGATVHALRDRVTAGARYRTESVRERIATRIRWRDEPYDDLSGDGRIDPRSVSIAIDDMLPTERIVAVDSGNFMGYPSMFLSVPDENGFCFTQAFQSVGLGLAAAIGAALAQPHRLPVAALGDGGFLMASSELETVVRLGLPLLVVVYNDAAYGAEVHHFGPDGYPLGTVTFPDPDIAQIAAGFGFAAVTARTLEDLRPVAEWLAQYLRGDPVPPMLIDAKVITHQASWWLEEAFRGH
ncbi:MAG: thiamine pyrophosphate-dependent enzyme, partial [Antricoccus sp.]